MHKFILFSLLATLCAQPTNDYTFTELERLRLENLSLKMRALQKEYEGILFDGCSKTGGKAILDCNYNFETGKVTKKEVKK